MNNEKKSLYKKVDSGIDFCAREAEVLQFWKEKDIFKRSIKARQKGEPFSFYDGPPTANGKPHIGHILTRVMKDIIPRYQTMKGKKVYRKAGWDTHGLPVELEVEKSLGINGKQQIETYGIEPFIKRCKESVWKYKSEWERMSDRVGYWVDMEQPYITYDDNYIESVWWSIKQIADQGLLYRGHKVVPYCPRCGTALSSHEVAQGYKTVTDTSIFVKFKVIGQADTYFLAWTTTPWTLPSNVALCVNPDETYCKIKVDDSYYILADERAKVLFPDSTVVERKKGNAYGGMQYQPLFPYAQPDKKAYYIVADRYVTLTDGSGIVHIAPAFGEDDARVGKENGLPFVQLINEQGKFIEHTGELEGKFCKDADVMIIRLLKQQGLLWKELPFEHSYPFCWRCDTPLLYYARSTWFINMTKVKDKLIKNNALVHWMPEAIGTGRMGNFLENVCDWGLSRERYWGTPLPVWVCDDCGKFEVIGSRAQLKERTGDITELHRPYLDQLTMTCICGKTMHRTPEVIDCWYDSGSMPFAQYHYPFENKKLFEENYPADFISEAVDQTRGWFYTLLAISTLIFDRPAFKNCIVLGHVNDKSGQKMSKHKGNVVDPWTVLDKQGADAVRWYFYTASAPWLPSRFYEEAVSEAQRKFMGTLWNTYAFFTLYADIDGYNPSEHQLKKCKLTLMDQWILSRLHSLIASTDRMLAEYNIFDSARKIQDFTDELSNWYIRRGRERFWGNGMTSDKKAAYTTLWTVLSTLSKLIAPYTPFIAESIYQNLVPAFFSKAPESVHLCDFPTADASYIDQTLEQGMNHVLDVVTIGRAARNASNIKNRQPLSTMFVASDRAISLNKNMLDIVADELNVKKYQNANDLSEFVTYELKPQLKTLGPKYGALISDIRDYLNTCDTKKIVDTVRHGKTFCFDCKQTTVALTEPDLLITAKQKTGFATQTDKGITVALCTELTDDLINEGIARELVSKIQTMRKDHGLHVTDRIEVVYQATGKALHVLQNHVAMIQDDVLCTQVIAGTDADYHQVWDINGEQVTLGITKRS